MLTPHARVVLETLLPAQAHPRLLDGALDPRFEPSWTEFQRTAAPALRLSFQAAVLAATWIAPLLVGSLPPLGRLDHPAREQALAALDDSRWPLFRQLILVLKLVASFAYGADPAVRAALGYPAAPLNPPAGPAS
jgi:hypothetical protein